MFKGMYTALVTPFMKGEVDYKAFEALVQTQLEAGIHGLVPCGSTGECFFLTLDEQKKLIERTVAWVSKKIPVIAGTGSITTEETLLKTRMAQQAGADAALIVSPPYVRPSMEAIYVHYKTIAEAVDLPLIIYNNPARTGSCLDQETIGRLAKIPSIVGIKDSTHDLTRPTLTQIALGDTFSQFSGEDSTAVAFWAQGGHGLISVVSNAVPRLCTELYEAWEKKDFKKMTSSRNHLMPLIKALALETNPVSIKCALFLLGKCQDEVRKPLLPATETTRVELQKQLRQLGQLAS